jgi:predicted nucleic acid-binding protein
MVVDASVAGGWLLPDERQPACESAYKHLDTDYALVPRIWWFEIRNLLIMAERRKRLDEQAVAEALSALATLPLRQDDNVDEAALLRLARQHRLTVYDASYLELAKREDIPLATLDRELARAARSERVTLV